MKKKFRIFWKLERCGYSEIEAKDPQNAENRADESVDDFGDPEQFTEVYDINTGWKVDDIEEVI